MEDREYVRRNEDRDLDDRDMVLINLLIRAFA